MKPAGLSDEDYISDDGLEKLVDFVQTVAVDFDLDVQGYLKSAVATFKFETPADVFQRAQSIYSLAEAAMYFRTLITNLQAERAENARLRGAAT